MQEEVVEEVEVEVEEEVEVEVEVEVEKERGRGVQAGNAHCTSANATGWEYGIFSREKRAKMSAK